MIRATFEWLKDGVLYEVKGNYWPSEPQTSRDPFQPSFFEHTAITNKETGEPYMGPVSDSDRFDLWERADEVYSDSRRHFFASVMQ